ncbi:MAG: sensor histidine kinase, partial [Cyanothece sp. SIO1E1]|nr:sensor histidine kinase [Cyanothece sp. SIO1E1]
VLYNLLSNALKYSDDSSPVEFLVRRQGEFLEFVISDQGIGIPVEDHGRLFESFHRASNVSAIPGTGLGLNIAKRAVEAHGGTISYESAEGVGTTFMVCLPLA